MKLRKVISGGQTGADRAGLEYARILGLETGGTAPKGYRTERGDDPTLASFGLVEDISSSYPPRTRQNVKDADATLWFGNIGSPGYWCTRRAADSCHKPLIENPTDLAPLAELYEVINVAGNRESKNPGVIKLVRDAFETLKESL